ncbi:hypothetical protein EV368DRAFT_80616 [Lentinula lateritia]|nr:hypothetical protein EV368DRAFT_80616 [Lentinula lateritia]
MVGLVWYNFKPPVLLQCHGKPEEPYWLLPPRIRIGANSEDYTKFDLDVQLPIRRLRILKQTISASEIVTIPPPDTEVIWGVDFGRNNLTAAIVETTSIMQAFSGPEVAKLGISLKFLEIGNEPGQRTTTLLNTSLRWTDFADGIFQEMKLNTTSTRFLASAFAGSSSNFKGFSLQAIFNLYKVPLRFSKHTLLPRGTFCSGSEGVLSDLMSKANIRGNLSQYASDIKATNDQGFDYGAPGVDLTSTYIAFDRLKDDSTALTRSISDGFPLSAPLPPYIQPQYYAGIVAAQAIGPYGNTLISELTIDNPQISGYAFYDDSQVKRILINHTHHMSKQMRLPVLSDPSQK